LGQGILNIVIAGVISGFIGGLAALTGLSAVGGMGNAGTTMMGTGFGIMAFVTALIITPILLLIGLFIISAIIYVFALILKGKGDFTKQTYMIAMFWSPILVVGSIAGIIPFVGGILNFLVGLYGLYLLTLALKQVHKVSTTKAVVMWIVPIAIVMLVLVVLASAFLMAMLPLAAAM